MNYFKNLRGKEAISNITRLYFSQLVSVGFGFLMSLYIPKFIGIEEFSYWQLFLFYAGYTGVLQLGLNDGLYLRYGGQILTKDECESISSQLWLSIGIISLICVIFIGSITSGIIQRISDPNLIFIYCGVAIYAIVYNIFGFCSLLCQALNRFKSYTTSFIWERVIMGMFLLLMICFSIKKFRYIEICWIISLAIVTIRILSKNKDLFLRRITINRTTFHEIKGNIEIGISLMLSNVSSILIIGVCRFFISEHYPLTTFGYVSFSLSLCMFCLVFISKIGLGIYPLLRRKSEVFHRVFYEKMNYLLTLLMPLTIILFMILNMIVKYFLPKYFSSLEYLAIFFPLCLFTAKIDMLYSTYLKILREEKCLLKINFGVMLLSVVVSATGIYLLENLAVTLIGVSICIIIKAYCMQKRVQIRLKLQKTSPKMLSDVVISLIYLALIGSGVDFMISTYILLIFISILIYFHHRSLIENLRFIFVSK